MLTINYKKVNLSLKIIDIAKIIKEKMLSLKGKEVPINIKKNFFDPLSYRINSVKIYELLGFEFKKNVILAIEELIRNFENGKITDSFLDK